ncbi:MAG: hypothetical protein GX797_07705 [Chloroflexi bacterium]|jgi:hypothetical protein|nr:hypothetical protein [Chloroflexota bacterium]
MSRTLRTTLITLGVLLLLYGVFYFLGRPAIPLPTIRYPVPQGQTLHNLVTATEADEIKLDLNTKGSLNLTSAGEELVKLNFTPQTLATTLDLALKLAPGETLQAYQQFVDRFPVYPWLLRYTSELFFHVLPIRFSVVMTP